VEREVFERAQQILAKGKTGRSNHYTPDTHPFAFPDLLRCGRCGCPLWGQDNRGHKYYHCSNRKHSGPGACVGTRVREDEVLRELADHLENWLGVDLDAISMAAFYGALTAEDLPEVFSEIKRLVMPPVMPKQDRVKLSKQSEALKEKVDKARANLVLLDAANIPAAQEAIRKLDEELAEIEKQLAQSKPPADKDINAVTLEVLNNLYSLAYCCRALARQAEEDREGKWVTHGSLESIAPQSVRRLARRISGITIHTSITGEGNGARHTFDWGEIEFRGVGVVTGKSSGTPPTAGAPGGCCRSSTEAAARLCLYSGGRKGTKR
jgi:hypothetical protein